MLLQQIIRLNMHVKTIWRFEPERYLKFKNLDQSEYVADSRATRTKVVVKDPHLFNKSLIPDLLT